MPTTSEITITTISGALPEPTIQFTLTDSRLSTANTVIRIASTSSAIVRAWSRLPRRGWCCSVVAGPCSVWDITLDATPVRGAPSGLPGTEESRVRRPIGRGACR